MTQAGSSVAICEGCVPTILFSVAIFCIRFLGTCNMLKVNFSLLTHCEELSMNCTHYIWFVLPRISLLTSYSKQHPGHHMTLSHDLLLCSGSNKCICDKCESIFWGPGLFIRLAKCCVYTDRSNIVATMVGQHKQRFLHTLMVVLRILRCMLSVSMSLVPKEQKRFHLQGPALCYEISITTINIMIQGPALCYEISMTTINIMIQWPALCYEISMTTINIMIQGPALCYEISMTTINIMIQGPALCYEISMTTINIMIQWPALCYEISMTTINIMIQWPALCYEISITTINIMIQWPALCYEISMTTINIMIQWPALCYEISMTTINIMIQWPALCYEISMTTINIMIQGPALCYEISITTINIMIQGPALCYEISMTTINIMIQWNIFDDILLGDVDSFREISGQWVSIVFVMLSTNSSGVDVLLTCFHLLIFLRWPFLSVYYHVVPTGILLNIYLQSGSCVICKRSIPVCAYSNLCKLVIECCRIHNLSRSKSFVHTHTRRHINVFRDHPI